MLNSNQIAHVSNSCEDTTSRGFEDLPEEVFEISSEENQVIDSSESKIENLQQENFDLKKNLELQKHYKKIAEESDEEVIELTREIQTLEGKIKSLKVTMEKQERKVRNTCEENERLEQQVEKFKKDLEDESRTKNSTINLLNEELKDKKDEIHFMNITNEKLNKDLDQAETLINRLKDQSEEKEKQLEDLIKNLTDDNKYLQEVEYLRGDVNQEKLKNRNLIEELNRLQKENEDLKLKILHLQPGRSLLDELSEAKIKADKFTQTENGYDKGEYSHESDLGYASFLDGIKPESSSEQKCLEPNRLLNLENQDLIRELSTLQNDDHKSKPLCFQTKMLLSDEPSEVKIKADKFTQTEISYDRGSCQQEKINEAGKLLDKGYYSFSEQETELSTDQERSKTDKTLKRLLKKFKEEQVNNKYQLIKEYLCSSFERCSFTFHDCSLMDITEDTFDNLMRIWFVHRSNLLKSENEKKLNEELLNILSSTGNNYTENLERFLLDNKDNHDLKTVLNLRRGESGLTILHALSSVANKDKDYDNAVGLLLKAGADPNIHNDRGQTPLHCANGYNSIASLLKAGANPNQQDNQGKTPLHYAAKIGLDKKSMNLFLESRAKLDILDKQGKTPLDIAIDNDNKYIECFFTDNQKRLKKELSNELRFQGDSVGLTEGLKQFLHKHKNDQDLKVVFNLCEFEIVPEVRRLLFLEAEVTYKMGYRMEEYVPESSLWYNLILNQSMELDELFKKASKVQNMYQLSEIVDQAIQSGVRFNFFRSFYDECGEEIHSFMDLIVNKIGELNSNFEIASEIVCKLLSRGAMLYRVDAEDLFDTLEWEFEGHKTNIVKAYEDYINRTTKFMEIAKSATNGRIKNAKMDNSSFYLEYSEDSTIDVAKITDGERDLGFTQEVGCGRNIIKIGKSEVEIITQDSTRNYTDLADGSDIVLTFDTSFGELEVRLYPDKENENLVIVEVNDEDLLEEIETYDEKIGKNCLLGGLSVSEAINQGSFNRSRALIHSEKIGQSDETKVNLWKEPAKMRVVSNLQETQATLYNKGTHTIL